MIRVEALTKGYSGSRAAAPVIKDVAFEVPDGKFYTLLGPSGCGKTTTLRCIAGLERPDYGVIEVGGAVVFSSRSGAYIPPYRRSIGMVFQSYAIWPHMTVFENAAFPLRVGDRKQAEAVVRTKVESALALVGLEGLEGRGATQLSGGQQQRLALARALVREPRLLLLDEPLSNLDAKLRERMRTELRSIQQRLGITTLYVTHDQAEALSMSDVVAVMQNGAIVREGAPRDVYADPRSEFVARFMGGSNLFPGLSIGPGDESTLGRFETGVGEFICPSHPLSEQTAVTIMVRPEDVFLHTIRPAAKNVFQGSVTSVSFLGDRVEYEISIAGQVIHACRNHSAAMRTDDAVFVEFPTEHCRILASR